MPNYDDELHRLGERIRRLRRGKALTQKDLAEKAGVFDVGEIERGRKVKGGGPVNPRLETLWRIAQALDSSLGELMGGVPVAEDAEMIAQLLDGCDEVPRRRIVSVVKALCE